MSNSGIYVIEHTASGKKYVGSSVNLHRRLREHKSQLASGRHYNKRLLNAYVKYGLDAFTFTVVELVADKHRLIEREQCWIDASNCIAHGYNTEPTAGSCLGRVVSEETKVKIAAAQRGKAKPKHTPAQRAARAKWCRGKAHLSAEARQRMSDSQKGKPKSPEVRARMAEAAKRRAAPSPETKARLAAAGRGRVVDDATKAKISAALIGRKVAPPSEEQKALASLRMQGRVWTPEQIARRVATKAANRAANPSPCQPARARRAAALIST